MVEESDENELFWKDGNPDDQLTISDQLNSEQQQQLNQLLKEFGQVLQNQPGHIQLVEHKIDMVVRIHLPIDCHKCILLRCSSGVAGDVGTGHHQAINQ